jgi:hypothetical protein
LVGQLDAPLAERYIRDLTRLQRHVPPRSIGGSIAFIANSVWSESARSRRLNGVDLKRRVVDVELLVELPARVRDERRLA